jgi:hypothetical protein
MWYTRWFKYDRDKLWLVYTQLVPVIFEPPCITISQQRWRKFLSTVFPQTHLTIQCNHFYLHGSPTAFSVPSAVSYSVSYAPFILPGLPYTWREFAPRKYWCLFTYLQAVKSQRWNTSKQETSQQIQFLQRKCLNQISPSLDCILMLHAL